MKMELNDTTSIKSPSLLMLKEEMSSYERYIPTKYKLIMNLSYSLRSDLLVVSQKFQRLHSLHGNTSS